MTVTHGEHKGDKRILGLAPGVWAWVVLFFILGVTTVVRFRLLDVPLERDEGEYAYAGQLILEGIPPYAQVYNMKLPGIYTAYAVVLALFGQTATGIHLGLWVVNCLAVMLVFFLGRRLFGPLTGAVAGASYAVLSLSQSVQGVFANSEHFVIPFALIGVLLILRALDSGRTLTFFWSGLFFGLAFVVKQHGFAFLAFGGIYLVLHAIRNRRRLGGRLKKEWASYLLGAILPFALTCIILLAAGVFDRFWFWTFTYAATYVSAVPLEAGARILGRAFAVVSAPCLLFWILAGLGLISLKANKALGRHSLFLLTFFVFSFVAICPGFYFRPHYFVLLLPAVSLFIAAGVLFIARLCAGFSKAHLKQGIPVLAALAALLFTCIQERDYLFRMTPNEVSRSCFDVNPFPESPVIADYLRERTEADDLIAVVGSEPQIYFYSGRRSATGYIYTYALMEYHDHALQMQHEMIEQIESAEPAYLVFSNVPSSWTFRQNSHYHIIEWFQKYAEAHYDLVGIVDLGLDQAYYYWEEEALKHPPLDANYIWVAIYKKKPPN